MNAAPPTPRQARFIWAALTGLSIAALVALGVTLVWGLGRVLQILAPVLWPLAVAGVLAYLLDPVVDWFERKGLSRAKAIICVFAIALVIIAGLAASVLPQLISESSDLISHLPTYTRRAEMRLEEWLNHSPALMQKILPQETRPPQSRGETNATATESPVTDSTGMKTNGTSGPTATGPSAAPGNDLGGSLQRGLVNWVATALPKIGSWLLGKLTKVASLFGIVIGLVLIPVYLFYLLLEKRGIRSSWTDYLPVRDSRLKGELIFVLGSINDILITFFRGQVLVAICDGILYTIGFLIIGLPYAVLMGVTAVFLTIVPFIGAVVVCVVALLISLVQFGDWEHPVLVLVVVTAVQSTEALVISPKIMGERVGLHPLTIIISVMAGTTLLGGLLGGLLAIPLTAALKVLMYRYVWKKRKE